MLFGFCFEGGGLCGPMESLRHGAQPDTNDHQAPVGSAGFFMLGPPTIGANFLSPFLGGRVPLLKSTTEKSWYPSSNPSRLEDLVLGTAKRPNLTRTGLQQ